MNTSAPEQTTRFSLFKVFSAGLAGIFLIFAFLSYFTLSRLLSFESALVQISNHTLPNLIQASQLYNQAAKLLEFTEQLSQSSSFASKRLVERKLKGNLAAIEHATKKIQANEFLNIQFNTIELEIKELSQLVSELLILNDKMSALKGKIVILGDKASNTEQLASTDWLLHYLQALLKTEQALDESRLQKVRLLFSQLEAQLTLLNSFNSAKQLQPIQKYMTSELKNLVFADDGLAQLKINALRLQGRTIGRGNFLHHLIDDYVSHLGYVSSESEQNITQQVALSVQDMEQETQLIRYLLVGGVIVLLIIILLFQRRVLNRLKIVNLMVRNQTLGDNAKIALHGNDEITDLASTFKEFTDTIKKQKQALEQLSMLDGLTGIPNRRALDMRLAHDLDVANRQQLSLAILLMDIDNFKLYNDNYGHLAGDNCLKKVANILQELLQRNSDFVARFGGEEYVCILLDTTPSQANRFAQTIIDKLKAEQLPHSFSEVTDFVTLSIGVAIKKPTETVTLDALLQKADEALYSAKASGKNTYKVYE